MNVPDCIEDLRRSGAALATLLDGISSVQAHWRPTPERWSLVEVINHLADEEHEDFRQRLQMTLTDPSAEWPPTDPQVNIVARDYNARDLCDSLGVFLEERKRSIEWLETLSDVNLESVHEHPVFPPLTAGDLMVSWIAHDLHHIRQIVRIQLEYLELRAAPYSIGYATG